MLIHLKTRVAALPKIIFFKCGPQHIYIYIYFLSLNPILRYRLDVHRNVGVSRLNAIVVDDARKSVTDVVAVPELAAVNRPIIALTTIVFGLLLIVMYRRRRRRQRILLGRGRRTLGGRLQAGGRRSGVRAGVVRKMSDGRSPRACKFIRDHRFGTPGHLVRDRALLAFNMWRHDGWEKRRLRVELCARETTRGYATVGIGWRLSVFEPYRNSGSEGREAREEQ